MKSHFVRILLMMVGFLCVNLLVNDSAFAAMVFEDDFESTTLDAWDSSSDPAWTNGVSNAHSGTRKARVAGNVENASLVKSVSTKGYTNLNLSYWYDTSTGWDSKDSVVVEWSADGSNWNELGVIDEDDKTPVSEGGEEWLQRTHDLAATAEGVDGFMMRFRATISGQGDIAYLDDVILTGEGGDTPAPTVEPTPTTAPSPTSAPQPTSTPQPTSSPKPTSTPQPTSAPKPTKAPKPTAQPTVEPTPDPDPTPETETFWDLLRRRVQLLYWLLRWVFGLI